MTTMNVLDSSGSVVAVEKPLTPGRSAAATSRPVVLSTEDKAAIDAITTALASIGGFVDGLEGLATALNSLLPAALGSNGGLKTVSPDVRPASGNITAQDAASSTASGQNSVSIITGSATANSTYSQAVNGMSTARVEVTGTWTGTLAFEGSPDGGTTWVGQTARVTGTAYTQGSVTGNGVFSLDISGLTNFRVRSTASMTGTAVVQAAFAAAPGFIQITNPLRLVDNSSGAQASIKAASTPPATSDTALVTAIADGNHVTIGAKADAANTATNTTPITAMSVWKQISASAQAIATWTGSAISVATHAVTQSGTWNVTNISGTVSLPTGAATSANQSTIISALATNHSDEVQLHADIATTLHADLIAATPAGINLIGRAVADASAATGGIVSTVRLLSAVGTAGDATNVKASAGRLYAIQGYNAATAVRYLKLYNSASAPTAGSGTPVKTLVLPPSCGFAFDWPLGYSFSAGLGFTLVTGSADNSSTGVTAADILGLNLDYA